MDKIHKQPLLRKDEVLNIIKITEYPLSINQHIKINYAITDALFLRIEEIRKKLNNKYYTFTHGVSIKIAAFHDIVTAFLNNKVSLAFRGPFAVKNLRVPGIGDKFTNTSDFLNKKKSTEINDHELSDSLISCDGFHSNAENSESAIYFYKINKNIVAKVDNLTQQLINCFKSNSIKTLIKNKIYNMKFTKFANGKIYLIAIPKNHIENVDVNYIYRSHPFGGICKCTNENINHGHDNFVEVLNKNNNNIHTSCNGILQTNPQYRILADNLEKDKLKKIFTIGSINKKEDETYSSIVNPIKILVKTFARLEGINTSISAKELESIILRINISNYLKVDKNEHTEYMNCVKEVIKEKIEIIQKHKEYLFKNLPKDHQEFLICNKLV